jgi:hypothetical protein
MKRTMQRNFSSKLKIQNLLALDVYIVFREIHNPLMKHFSLFQPATFNNFCNVTFLRALSLQIYITYIM